MVNKLLAWLKDYKKNIQDSAWLISDRFVRSLLQFVLSIILARYLEPELFGVYNYAYSLAHLAMQFAVLGLSGIVVNEILDNPEEQNSIVDTVFILRLIASVIGIGVTYGVVSIISTNITLKYLSLVVATFLSFNSLEAIDLWLQAKEKNKIGASFRIISIVVTTLLIVFAVYSNASLIWITILTGGEYAIIGIGYILYYYGFKRSLFGFHFSWSVARNLLRKSWPLIISSIGVVIYRKIDQVMLGSMVGNTEVGIYAVAARLSEAWYLVPVALSKAFFPKLIQAKNEGGLTYKKAIQNFLDLLFNLSLVIAIAVTILGPYIINFFYGSEYSEASIILTIHIWACLFIFLREGLSKWLIIENLLIFSLITHGVGAIVNIVLNLVLIPYYGGIGAAVSTVIAYFMASYGSLFFSQKTYGIAKQMTRALASPIRIIKGF